MTNELVFNGKALLPTLPRGTYFWLGPLPKLGRKKAKRCETAFDLRNVKIGAGRRSANRTKQPPTAVNATIYKIHPKNIKICQSKFQKIPIS